jgi:uncharacterized membrane protein YhfC
MTPLISPLFFLTGTAMILVALGAVLCWQRGKPSLWPMVWFGVLAWTASLAVKAAAGLPMMNFFQRHADNPFIWFSGGLVTGVFECTIPLFLILKTRLRWADFNGAVAFGIGFGGIEVFLMGSVALVQTALLVAFPNHIPTGVRDALLKQFAHSSIATILLSIIERASALAAHCLASVLLIYAVRTRRQLWFWLSCGYKTLIDTFAAWAILAWKMPGNAAKTAKFEVVIAIFALFALVALPRLKTGFTPLDDESRLPLPAPPPRRSPGEN